ncbi:FAD-dependent oxidoreductase [Psychrobacillus sp. NPDC096623]|uniref:FAD-dependent oxidoreductase n=1 Tax=Psychrobacillus sp. NPDC096623 TaxID=3364492 RepID=UPI0038252C65
MKQKLLMEQLVKLFGNEAKNAKVIAYKDWSSDSETAVEEDSSLHKNYQSYGQPLVDGVWEKKIIFTSTETDQDSSGHLEGALRSAEQAVYKIIGIKNKL